MSGVWLIILLCVGLFLALDVAFVSWWYALDDRPARLEAVVLCHGLANNHRFMEFRVNRTSGEGEFTSR